jgi:hypothetical protein
VSDETAIPDESAFQAVVAAVKASRIVTPEQAAAALTELRNGIITGDGPTARGRVHFSRTLDSTDSAICQQILVAPGSHGAPVSRKEADILFEIDAVAAERLDGGRFDDLFVKAVAHHAIGATGHAVPPRAVALDAATPLESWASPAGTRDVDAEILRWIADHVQRRRRLSNALMTIAAFLIGAGATGAMESLSSLVDLLA